MARNSSCTRKGRVCTTIATRSRMCSVWRIDKVYDSELVSNGGAFGGKEYLAMQQQSRSWRGLTKRPSRRRSPPRESMRFHPKRHPIKFEYWAGCDKDGHFTCVKVRAVGDKAAYASVGTRLLGARGGQACGPYKVPASIFNTMPPVRRPKPPTPIVSRRTECGRPTVLNIGRPAPYTATPRGAAALQYLVTDRCIRALGRRPLLPSHT